MAPSESATIPSRPKRSVSSSPSTPPPSSSSGASGTPSKKTSFWIIARIPIVACSAPWVMPGASCGTAKPTTRAPAPEPSRA